MLKVLVTDPLNEKGVAILKKAGFDVDEKGKLSPAELAKVIGKYDVLVVRSGTKATAEVIEKADRLKLIGRAGVGLDNIDVEKATEKGIIVMNAPEGNTTSAAEHAIGMMFALARNIPRANASVKEGKWERKKFMGAELYGKTLGIVGLGRIGRRVAQMARAIGMKTLAYDPYISDQDARALDIGLVGIEGLCRKSDFVTFHIPLTDETYHLVGKKELALMRKGVRIINCARGGVLDEAALNEGIVKGKVAGAALDVYEKEPPEDSPLLMHDGVVMTPHLGASTKEAQVNVAVSLAEQIVEAFSRKIVRNAVNLPRVDAEFMEQFGGYLPLAEKMGRLLCQMEEGKVRELEISYRGEIVNSDISMVRNSVLKGFLDGRKDVSVVNAPLVMKESGIQLKERRAESAGEFSTLVTVKARGRKTHSASGTLIRKDVPRIVGIDGFPVDAVPEGILLVSFNEDKPGIMGHIGTVLGKQKVNIASMTLGRKKRGGPALTVLNLDQEISGAVVKKIEEFPAINLVKLVKL